MEIYLKAVSGILIAIILIQVLSRHDNNIALLVSILACCMVFSTVGNTMKSVISFFDRLKNLANLNSDMISIILKATGIGYLSEIATNICQDIGNSAMSKALQILSLVTLFAMSIPIFNELLDLIENVLANL